MKFKTWEKIYWGVVGAFFVLALVPLFGKGDIEVRVQGKETFLVSKGVYFGYLVVGYVIISVPIWLIVRWIVNRGGG